MAVPSPSDLAKQAGTIYDLLKKGATIEAQEHIMELRRALLDLGDENLALRTELSEARQRLSLRSLLARDGKYWTPGTDDKPEDGPFCQRCADSDGRLMRLGGQDNRGNPMQTYCFRCKNYF